jgi:RNA polymerase sigma factor (sigma-70 family)
MSDSHQVSDWELLRQYVEAGSQAAFAEVVRRYLDFVYSTALRRTGRDAHLAEDVTQAVFMILAQKARTIRAGVVLSGWLHHTTRYAAANALKGEARHERRKRALRDAAEGRRGGEDTFMSETSESVGGDGGDWEAVAPLLDYALDRLGATDRDAVLLRFIHGKSHRDVAEAIGVTEEAARKRIERAIVRMREYFVARGVSVGAMAIGMLLATKAVEAAPAGLAASATSASATSASAASASAASAASPGGGTVLAKGAMSMMALAKVKLVAACVAAALVVSTAAAVTVKHVLKPARAAGVQSPINAPAVPAQPVIARQPAPKDRIDGVVFGIDGEPLPGAEVYLATPSKGISGFKPDGKRNPPQITEKDGKFSFPMTKESPAFIAVYHPDGFAQVEANDVVRTPQVFIRPWARVEGVLLDGGTPLPGENLFLGAILNAGDPVGNCITYQTTFKTDREGKFTLEHVPPIGGMYISRQRSTPWMIQSKWDYLTPKPGETVKVQLGGRGRHVVGRLLPPPGPVPGIKGAWAWEDARAGIKSDIGARFMDVKGFSAPFDPSSEQWKDAERAWQKTDEGVAYLKYKYADEYPVQADGTFRFEDLRPGKYSLYAAVRQEDKGRRYLEDVATAQFEFEVPPLPAGKERVEESLDIGQIKTEIRPRMVVGEAAPDFKLESLDGQPISLATYKGKMLLIHFRRSWSKDDEWDGLKKAHEAFGKDPQFAMLTVHLEPRGRDKAALQAEAEKQGVRWTQAVVADKKNRGQGWAAIDQAYQRGFGVTLIDGEGKVMAKNIRAETAESDVAKAMLERG